MSVLFYSLLLWIWDNRSFDTIDKANRAKIEAQSAFEAQDYRLAIEKYTFVMNASIFSGALVRLNLANAYFENKDFKTAKKHYSQLLKVTDSKIVSKAHTQLALIAVMYKNDTLTALSELSKALLQNPENETARIDYQILRKNFKGNIPTYRQKKTQKQQQTQENNTQTATEVQKTEDHKNTLNRLKNLGMSEAAAMAILDAMKANETQYLQQRNTTNKGSSRW